MADFPYDLNTYSIPELDTLNDVMFNHVSSREVTLSELSGWVENNPSATITGSLYLNGVDQGTGISISSGGVVTNDITFPINLVPGDHLQILADANIATPVTKIKGLALTFVGKESNDCYSDMRYDFGIFLEGRVPAGRVVGALIVPRQLHILDNEHWVTTATNPAASVNFSLRKNGTQFGSIIINTAGVSVLLMNSDVENFAKGDVISILSPGVEPNFVDSGTMQDLSVTLKGFLGQG